MEILLATTISCNQLIGLLQRLEKNLDLSPLQKMEVVIELKKYFKTCPIVIKKE